MIRFIQISDTHVGATPDYTLHKVNTLDALERLIDHLVALPFQPDFYLHTGDVIDDHSEAAYRLARPLFERLQRPVYYVVGNHDHAKRMQRVLLGMTTVSERYDYQFQVNGVQFAVFDTTGRADPNGLLTPEQIRQAREVCTPDGPPLVLITHHQAVPLDVNWLDHGARDWAPGRFMKIENSEAFLDAILPASARIRGVFFGHVHRAFQVMHRGISFFSAASAAFQFRSLPDDDDPLSVDDMPGYNVVTITENGVIVRQHMLR